MRFRNKYRIITDNFLGYQVDIKYWWLPLFWIECHDSFSICNTHRTIEDAMKFIEKHKYSRRKVVYQD